MHAVIGDGLLCGDGQICVHEKSMSVSSIALNVHPSDTSATATATTTANNDNKQQREIGGSKGRHTLKYRSDCADDPFVFVAVLPLVPPLGSIYFLSFVSTLRMRFLSSTAKRSCLTIA